MTTFPNSKPSTCDMSSRSRHISYRKMFSDALRRLGVRRIANVGLNEKCPLIMCRNFLRPFRCPLPLQMTHKNKQYVDTLMRNSVRFFTTSLLCVHIFPLHARRVRWSCPWQIYVCSGQGSVVFCSVFFVPKDCA